MSSHRAVRALRRWERLQAAVLRELRCKHEKVPVEGIAKRTAVLQYLGKAA